MATRVLTSTEAAELMRTSPRTLRTWASRHLVPGQRLGREWRFSEEALLAALERGDEERAATSGAEVG